MRVIKKPFKSAYTRCFVLLTRLTSCVIRIFQPRLVLTYDSSNPKDGTGAQLQRILSIYCLATYLRLDYLHTDVSDVSTHPLDPFQNDELRRAYVERVNSIFKIETTTLEFSKEIYLKQLKLFLLLKYAFASFAGRQKILLRINEPYGVVDFLPQCLTHVPPFPLRNIARSSEIVIHHRRGVGNFAIYHGQKLSRESSQLYFNKCLDEIWALNQQRMKVSVLTDGSPIDLIYPVPVSQRSNWVGTPGFDGENIVVKGEDLSLQFKDERFDFEFVYGGDPLEAIASMSLSRYLIISRSSLSYLGGILNKNGVVFTQSSFWHSPLPNWKIIKS